jgi:hypothetical protein
MNRLRADCLFGSLTYDLALYYLNPIIYKIINLVPILSELCLTSVMESKLPQKYLN